MLRHLLFIVALSSTFTFSTGCLKLDYEEVEVACNTDDDCPFGNTCVANRCYPPEIAEEKEQEIRDAQDAGGSSDGSAEGTTDGAQLVDS